MAETHTRSVPAPAQEWLTRRELANELDVDERIINQLIRAGRFPRGTPWNGKQLRWRWWVVVWYRLHKDVEPLLRTGDTAGDEDEDPDEAPKPPRK